MKKIIKAGLAIAAIAGAGYAIYKLINKAKDCDCCGCDDHCDCGCKCDCHEEDAQPAVEEVLVEEAPAVEIVVEEPEAAEPAAE